MHQPEDYPTDNHGKEYACPRCGNEDLKQPSPAMMEDDDWRLRCEPCLRRFPFKDARVAWLRTHSAQRAMTRTITT